MNDCISYRYKNGQEIIKKDGVDDFMKDIDHTRDIPNMFARIKNFSISAISHFLNGNPTCSQEQIDERLKICKSCEKFVPNGDESGICGHSSCGCNIKSLRIYLNKLAWADQECPIKKWEKIKKKNE